MSLAYTLPATVNSYRKWLARTWACGKFAMPPMPKVACTWAKLLKRLALNERDVLTVLEGSDANAEHLRLWVRRNYMRRFVPEPILEALGIDEAQVLRGRAEGGGAE